MDIITLFDGAEVYAADSLDGAEVVDDINSLPPSPSSAATFSELHAPLVSQLKFASQQSLKVS